MFECNEFVHEWTYSPKMKWLSYSRAIQALAPQTFVACSCPQCGQAPIAWMLQRWELKCPQRYFDGILELAPGPLCVRPRARMYRVDCSLSCHPSQTLYFLKIPFLGQHANKSRQVIWGAQSLLTSRSWAGRQWNIHGWNALMEEFPVN